MLPKGSVPFLLSFKTIYKMSRFNQPNPGTATTNLAGGAAFSQTPELELASVLLTSFVQDQYYRSAGDTLARLKSLISQCDPKFVAQAAIYARKTFGMRSITHVTAGELAKHIGGQPWGKNFYDKIVHRPDDMTEIAAYYLENCAEAAPGNKRKKKTLTHAMKKGFAAALGRLNAYSLAKYRGEGKGFKMVDMVNMVRPAYSDPLTALIKGELKSTDTWESKLTKAGQTGTTEEEVLSLKKDAWTELIQGKTLGYLALLRNLRNIMEQAPDVLPEALTSLTSPDFIKKSLIMPFQYLVAYKQFLVVNSKEGRLITDALSRAIDISCANIKELGFTGNTLIAVDNSGSMDAPVAKSEHMKRSELGALFGMVFAKAINADIMEFGDNARYINYRLDDVSMKFAGEFAKNNRVGHGTYFNAIFELAARHQKKYDRILIFSDMQGWVGGNSANSTFSQYKRMFNVNPFLYSFDLAGYGTMQFPEDKVFAIAGFSDKIIDIASKLEADKKALINEIKKVEI